MHSASGRRFNPVRSSAVQSVREGQDGVVLDLHLLNQLECLRKPVALLTGALPHVLQALALQHQTLGCSGGVLSLGRERAGAAVADFGGTPARTAVAVPVSKATQDVEPVQSAAGSNGLRLQLFAPRLVASRSPCSDGSSMLLRGCGEPGQLGFACSFDFTLQPRLMARRRLPRPHGAPPSRQIQRVSHCAQPSPRCTAATAARSRPIRRLHRGPA
jgi:hypothetical protein